METIPVRQLAAPQKEPPLSGSFSIRPVGDLLAGGDLEQELHRHDFYYLLALGEAAGDHAIDFVPYPVAAGTVFLMRPGQVHHLSLKRGSTGYLVQFTAGFYSPQHPEWGKVLRQAGHRNHCRTDASGFEKLLALLDGMYGEYTDKKEGYAEAIRARLHIFLIELLRQQKNEEAAGRAGLYQQERLEEFLSLLERHLSTEKGVSGYAALLHLSPYQLNAITKATLGKTASVLINEQIILESKRYLLATSVQVKEIAWYLGYEDVSYFIRFFKKHTGYSPEAFRQHFK